MSRTTEKEGVEAVDRALSVLRTLADGGPSMTLAALARETGYYKSTILRLLASLERFRLVERGADGLYRLGPDLWRMGALYRARFDLAAAVRPVLARLVEATGESASLYVADGDERICLYRLNSPRAARHHLEEGARLPLDRGAAGRVLLAARDTPGEPYAGIRAQGFYVSHGERDSDVASASVPVRAGDGTLVGALAVSALRTRFDAAAEAVALDALRAAAADLAAAVPTADPDHA